MDSQERERSINTLRDDLLEEAKKYLVPSYLRYPLLIVKGKGSYVWDIDGRRFLDFIAGIAVCNLGHSPDVIIDALKDQAKRLIHISNLYYIKPQIEFAKLLSEISFGGKAFFCNSGAEANEAAIKLARIWGKNRKNGAYEIITFYNSFHGRTLATLAATGQAKFRQGFEPVPSGFLHVPFNDLKALREVISEKTCAVMLEPIQAEGGVNLPEEGYLGEVREICDRNDLLLIFDEVQVGMGRTGKFFCYENYGVLPDIMTLAKGIAGGVVCGAMLAKPDVADHFSPGTHASTFGGNPLACACGIKTIETLKDGVLDNCRARGEELEKMLLELKERYDFIKDVRGKGLIFGVELSFPGKDVVSLCMDKGLLINCTKENVLRITPPLTIKKEELEEGVSIIDEALRSVKI